MFKKRCHIILPLLMLASAFASAQSMAGQWHGDLYSVLVITEMPPPIALIDEKNAIQKVIPPVSKAGDSFPVDARFLNKCFFAYWHNDALHQLAHGLNVRDKENKNLVYRPFTYAKWEDGEWNLLGTYKTGPNEQLNAIPCDVDRVILISSETDLVDNNRAERSPFARFSLDPNGKELRRGTSIAFGQDELNKYMSNQDVFGLPNASILAMTDKYAALINTNTGLYWVFSKEKASLVKAGNIFKKITPEMIAKGGFPSAIMSAQPEKDGTVLIAAQEEDFFIINNPDATANVYLEMIEIKNNNPYMTQEEYVRQLNERLKKQRENSPFIDWYRLHLENGKVEKLAEPPEGGTRQRTDGSLQSTANNSWRPMPDGSIKLGNLDRDLYESRKKDGHIADIDKAAKQQDKTADNLKK